MEAALRLGLGTFTMQGIAAELGVTTPALYSHVAGRDEVLHLVRSEVHRRMATFRSTATDWRSWFVDFARDVRRDLAPSAAALMAELRPPADATRLTVGEQGLRLLLAEGLSPAEAGYSMWLVFRVALTSGPEAAAGLTGYVEHTADLRGDPTEPAIPATLAVQAALAAGTGFDTLDFDLQVVLDGIAGRIAAARAAAT